MKFPDGRNGTLESHNKLLPYPFHRIYITLAPLHFIQRR